MGEEKETCRIKLRSVKLADPAEITPNWSEVTSSGSVEFRIETIDAASGQPTGELG